MKKSILLSRLVALLLVGMIFNSCSEDELQSPNNNKSSLITQEITSNELPKGILDQLSGIKSEAFGRSSGLGDLDIDMEKIIKAIYSDTRQSFVLRAHTDDNSTINLVFKSMDGEQEVFLIHYQPDQEWYDSKPNELSFMGFTGVIDFYNLDAELISSSIYENGTGISLNGKQLSGGRSTCYTLVESFSEFCEHEGHIEYHSDGTCSHPIEGVTFEIICEDSWSSGSGGSTSGSGGTYNGTGGTSGGGGTSGDDSNDDFVPINPDDLEDDAELLLDLLTEEEFLDILQEDKLKEAFKEVIDKCANKEFINELKNNGYKFKFKIDPNLSTPGGYSPDTKTISFRSTNDINYDTVLEELFHAYQDMNIGTSSFLDPPYTGRSNIEFEAKLYADIVAMKEGLSCCIAFWPLGNSDYWIWVNEITNNGTEFPIDFASLDGKYFNFLNEFINARDEYDYPIDNSLKPTSMFKPFNKCN